MSRRSRSGAQVRRLISSVSAWARRRASSRHRLEFREREGNLDTVMGVHNGKGSRVTSADFTREPHHSVEWPYAPPRAWRYRNEE